MPLQFRIDGHAGRRFTQVIRSLPDGGRWLISDVEGNVVIARNEGSEILREAILSPLDEGLWDVECLASPGVSEVAVQALVLTAIASCFVGLAGVWWSGLDGLLGLVAGVVAAGTSPAIVLGIGQWMLDPGRDVRAEQNLERAFRFAAAQTPGIELSKAD